MHFCSKCENMLYIRLVDETSDNLIYYCRSCGSTDENITKDNICVLKNNIVLEEKAYLHEINEYTKLDPTLPRTNNIKCPNQTCPSNKSINLEDEGSTSNEEHQDQHQQNDVIYLRYDDANMKYIYMCTLCDKIWKTSEQ